MKAKALGRWLEDLELAIGSEWRHGQRAFPRAKERTARVVAGNADLIFGFFVPGLQVVVSNGPIFKRASSRCSIN